jgi:hypothetical protein
MRNHLHVLRHLTRSLRIIAIAAIVAGASSAAFGQAAVSRAARGEPGKDIRIGVFVNVKQDCSSGPLPTIRLVDKPANGTVTVKSAKINAKNYKQCLALEVPGYVAFYKSEPTFNGVDTFSIEIRYPEGRTETQKLSVTVGDAKAKGRDI